MALSMMERSVLLTLRRRFMWLSRKYSISKNANVRVRFAPSPTGDMHLGGLRTALYNYLFAKSHGGKFVLRIEDTDQTRVIPGATDEIISVLKWARLHPDEGPGKGGDFGPYIQSERQHLYREYAEQLLQSGHAYRCFCTQKRMELLRKEQMRLGETSGYDNKCRNLTDGEIRDKLDQGLPHVIRFKYEPLREPCSDLIHGLTHRKLVGEKVEGDFIILKSDSYPTYHFANVVDDHLMKISHVLRGEEWSISTPKHIQMYEAFGWNPPQFAHLPLILNSDGTKLSKRQDDIKVEMFMKKFTSYNALLNYLTTSNGGFTDLTEGMTLNEMVKKFSLNLVTPNSTRLQPERLRQISRRHLKTRFYNNKDHIINLTLTIVKRKYGDRIEQNDVMVLKRNYIERTLTWGLKERFYELEDLVSDNMEFVWLPPSKDVVLDFSAESAEYSVILTDSVTILEGLDAWKKSELKKSLVACQKKNKLSAKQFFMVLRNCLSGMTEGPPIPEMMVMLGKKETLRRLNRAQALTSRSEVSGEPTSVES